MNDHSFTERSLVFADRQADKFAMYLESIKDDGQTLVLANGVFDVLHAGHIKLLHYARSRPWLHKPYLMVALNQDDSAARAHDRPVRLPWRMRAYALSALACVDMVVGFAEDTPEELIQHCEPDVLVKGREYARATVPGEEFVLTHGGVLLYAPMVPGVSTSEIFSGKVTDVAGLDWEEW